MIAILKQTLVGSVNKTGTNVPRTEPNSEKDQQKQHSKSAK
jgi:hypothetical protein